MGLGGSAGCPLQLSFQMEGRDGASYAGVPIDAGLGGKEAVLAPNIKRNVRARL